MASAGAGYAAATGAFTLGTPGAAATAVATPAVGWAIFVVAALVDTFILMPALQKSARQQARPGELLGAPVGSNDAGAPRIWAIGTRVRVPVHILWQDSKIRETTSTNNKLGTTTQLRRVTFDAALALNDRPTNRLVTLYGNGTLLLYRSRNQLEIRTSGMTLTQLSGTQIRLTMTDTLQPAFTDKFEVDDYVQLRGWTMTGGTGVYADINLQPWEVVALTDHSSATPSTITLERRWGIGVAMVGVGATAGNTFSPASIERIDDKLFSYRGQYGGLADLFVMQESHLAPRYIFQPGEGVRYRQESNVFGTTLSTYRDQRTILTGPLGAIYGTFGPALGTAPYARIDNTGETNITPSPTQYSPLIVEAFNPGNFPFGVFAAGWDPDSRYYAGSESQVADGILSTANGATSTPAYRGMSYQVLDGFVATLFGDQLPYSCEGVLEVDAQMDWQQAFAALLTERAGQTALAFDVTGVTPRPFSGMYVRGPLPASTALQPLLLAGQIMAQDRDGVLTFTEFQNADEVAIENGVVFSNFGTRLDGQRAADDKWSVEDQAVEDLPTKIGVRFQDIDNTLIAGYQQFGLRNPEGVDHINEQELDLSMMVMTRREAANLAATVLRRSWVNRRTYRFVLPAAYIDLLESDLLTWTDDEGVDHVARIIQRDIGSDFRVGITAIAEDLDLAVAGSPVQSAAGSVPQLPGAAAGLDVVIVDGPAYLEGQNRRPGLQIAIGTYGGNWSGAAIYESVDGTTYDLVDVVGKRATTGTLDTTLPSGQVAEYVGMTGLGPDAGSCTVTVTSFGASQMTSRTAKEVFSGLNWCALVKPDGTVEIAAFTSVTALGDNQFTLSGWLRGLRGTGNPYGLTVNEAPAGTRFVLLNGETYFREFAGEITPTALSYKIVPAGLGLEDVEQINVVSARRNALPLPVRTLTKTIDPVTFDARLTVTHNWCRAVLPLGTQPPHPMDEPLEAYRFTIYDTAGKQVRRVKTITASGTGSNTIRDRWIDYPASEQSADGYTPGASTLFTVDVQQIGEFGLGPSVIRKF